jgi:hypothetical protein
MARGDTMPRMPHSNHPLLERLDAIGASVASQPDALALIGLGSCGVETHRLDDWSDLDFFVIVAPGAKARFLRDLDWLRAAHPVAWHFQNTADGHKVLMADGVFCEFAVFEPQALEKVARMAGRIVWKRDGVDEALVAPEARGLPPTTDETWIVGEALSNLLVGLLRWHRGERLSAQRFVQSYALDRLIELDALRRRPPSGDVFSVERRIEQRQPALAALLPALAPGYLHTPQAALALLQALDERGAVLEPHITRRIRELVDQALALEPPARNLPATPR